MGYNDCCCNDCKSKCERDWKTNPDFIIVGAGTAGLTAAWGLTNKKGCKSLYSVLVFEAGLNYSDDPNVLDPTIGSSIQLSYNPKYAFTRVTLDQEVYSDGRGTGGGSMHNGLQAVRGTPDIYNQWATISGNNAWNYASLLPLFKSQEFYTPMGTVANAQQRGLNGRLYITQEAPLTDGFSAALATGLGTTQIVDYNDHYQVSPGVYANTVGVSANQDYVTPPPNSVRSFSGNSYLDGIVSVGIPPIVDDNGVGLNGRKLKVINAASVAKILFKQNKAIGIEVIFTKDNVQYTERYYARKGVIVSAGSVGTPALLQLSGIGKAADLTALGIDVVYDNANVGANLQNHYGPNALVRLLTTPPPVFKLNVAFADLHPYMPADGSRRTQTDFLFPGSIFFPQDIISALGLQNVPSVSVGGLLLQSKSRGSVKIQSNDPLTPPLLTLGNYTDDTSATPWATVGSDAYQAVSYLKLMQAVVVAEGGTPADVLYPPNSAYPAPWGPAADDSLLFQAAKNSAFNSYHAVGTCRMATSPADGVVDGKLAVFGVKHLYIADCSIEPLVQTGNTAYMAFFIGLQLAKFLGADLP